MSVPINFSGPFEYDTFHSCCSFRVYWLSLSLNSLLNLSRRIIRCRLLDRQQQQEKKQQQQKRLSAKVSRTWSLSLSLLLFLPFLINRENPREFININGSGKMNIQFPLVSILTLDRGDNALSDDAICVLLHAALSRCVWTRYGSCWWLFSFLNIVSTLASAESRLQSWIRKLFDTFKAIFGHGKCNDLKVHGCFAKYLFFPQLNTN